MASRWLLLSPFNSIPLFHVSIYEHTYGEDIARMTVGDEMSLDTTHFSTPHIFNRGIFCNLRSFPECNDHLLPSGLVRQFSQRQFWANTFTCPHNHTANTVVLRWTHTRAQNFTSMDNLWPNMPHKQTDSHTTHYKPATVTAASTLMKAHLSCCPHLNTTPPHTHMTCTQQGGLRALLQWPYANLPEQLMWRCVPLSLLSNLYDLIGAPQQAGVISLQHVLLCDSDNLKTDSYRERETHEGNLRWTI